MEPGILSIAFTPAVAHLAPDFNRCGLSLESTALISEEVPANYLSLDNTDIALRMGVPPLANSHAFVVLEDRLVVITHIANPLESINMQELVALYTQNGVSDSGDTDPIDLEPFAYPEDSDIHQSFLNFISAMKIGTQNISIVPDPIAMIEEVSENVLAVGVIPLSALTTSVREIPIQDRPDNREIVQVLAMTRSAPKNMQLEWIHCLQNIFP